MVWACLFLAGALPLSAQQEASESTEEYRNWVELSLGATFEDGDKAAFQRRYGIPGGTAFGGIEEFHFEQDVGKRGLFSIDGRGIFDNHDYSIRLELSEPEKGFVRAGYREFRTYYDGSGGFFPRGTNNWFNIYDDTLFLDRGEVWFEAGLRRPEVPELTFRYSHQFRDGRKDSTVWGDSNLTGTNPNTGAALGGRGFVPSFWDIDEIRDIFQGDAKHTVGKTEVALGVRYELFENNNSRNIRRRPLETTGGTAGSVPDRYLTQREGLEGDLFNFHTWSDTRFTEKVQLTLGYSFTVFDTDISGSRIYGASYDPVYDPLFARRQQRDEGFLDLAGGSLQKQHVGNINVMWTPWEKFAVVAAVRVEDQDTESHTDFLETNVGAAPARTSTQEELAATSDRGILDVSESLEFRYTGFTNWVLYARGYWMQGRGDLREIETLVETNIVDLLRDTEFEREAQKYTVGANWYPCRFANFAVSYYHKIRREEYEHQQDTTPNRAGNAYPAFILAHDFDTDDVNFRVTLRPRNNLTLVTRYDFQLSTIDLLGDRTNLLGMPIEKVQSGEVTTHIISQSVSWTPFPRLYLQASGSYVIDETDTPVANWLGTNNLVLNSMNNYWNASGTAGYVLSEKTDLQAQYFYYRADNYEDNSLDSMPYGVDAEEHGVIGTVIHRLTNQLRLSLKYGFFRNREATFGGHNDYDAHLVYSSLQYRF
jgi:hypothetical protein